MPETIACVCNGDCGNHDGRCGKPVDGPFRVQHENGPEYGYGVCQACWNAVKAAGKFKVPQSGPLKSAHSQKWGKGK